MKAQQWWDNLPDNIKQRYAATWNMTVEAVEKNPKYIQSLFIEFS